MPQFQNYHNDIWISNGIEKGFKMNIYMFSTNANATKTKRGTVSICAYFIAVYHGLQAQLHQLIF